MWYFLSLVGLCCLIAGLAAPGALVVDACLPFRQRPVARRFLSPLLGLALLVLPATLLGWFGGGYRWWICLPLTLGLVAVGRWRRIVTAPGAVRHGLALGGFCVLASLPFLGQLAFCQAFDPFNDSFFYLAQAQWLQGHGFVETVHPDGFNPAWAQVATFQQTSLRMGPSFLLGWLQAAGGVSWSYQVFPLVSSMALVAGGLAVAATVSTACPGWRRAAWLAALIAAAGRNGFAVGPMLGFFPQTCGLAFAAGAVALRALEMRSPPLSVPGAIPARLRAGFPLALLAAATVFCYPEIFPFLAAAWLASHGLSPAFPRRSGEWRLCWARIWPTAALVGLLVNVEWVRVWAALQLQAHVVSGFPIAWRPWEFAAHSLGVRGPFFTQRLWLWNVRWVHVCWVLPAVLAFVFLVKSRAKPPTWLLWRPRALLPAAWQVIGLAVAFGWFRYAAANPWPAGLDGLPPGAGQTWSQFKLSEWASPAAVTLGAAGLVALARWHRMLPTALLLGWAVVALGWSVGGIGHPTRAFRHAMGVSADPFAPLLALRASLAAVPKDEVVYLDLRGDDFKSRKSRELPVYFLSDRRLAGDWTADSGLLAHLLPEAERNMPVTMARWIVRAQYPAAGAIHYTVERLEAPTAPRPTPSG